MTFSSADKLSMNPMLSNYIYHANSDLVLCQHKINKQINILTLQNNST